MKMLTICNVVIIFSIGALASTGGTHSTSRTFPESAFNSVHMDVDCGDITVNDSSGPNISISYERYGDCNLYVVVESNVLVIKHKNGNERCHAKIAISIPSSKPVTVVLGKGQLHSTTYRGSLSVNMGAGNILVDNPTQSLRVDGGSIKNMTGTGNFNYGSGALNFVWDTLPKLSANLTFSIGSGYANLSAPAEAKINTRGVDSTPGFLGFGGFSIKSEFADTKDTTSSSHIIVSGSGGSGEISVKKNLELSACIQ